MVRIQLDLPEEQVKELDELMAETKIVTRKDLFNDALTLFQWAAKAKRAGRIIASLDEESGTARELVMPALENVPTLPKPDRSKMAVSERR
jgi:metal-responsive CopG/Arc/MetJ family transcriptional regulator